MLSDGQREVLRATSWFNSMPERLQKAFIDVVKLVSVDGGMKLYNKGDKGNGFHCVLSGKIKVSNINRNGKQVVLGFLSTGTWFGEISMFDGLGRTHDTHAEENSMLAFVSRSDFHRIMAKHPEAYEYFTQLLCQRLRTTLNFIDSTASLSLKQQLVKRLILISSNLGQRESNGSLPAVTASQEALAMMINSSRQSVNRLLKELERDGLIQNAYRHISLLDVEALKIFCEWE
ncbi:Crp/Fnr family transcriptional regulator [Glaciecola siphonariae]|uniref:Crp/Fnr family transcriptional regulator n=1 Tax=Glaciecola siphonariae TaxID=521012 RepID=A0ABV9LTY3_9ALTE